MFGGSKRKIDDLIDNRWPVPSVWTLVQIIKRKLHKVPINAVWWNRMKHCQVEGRRRKKSLQGTWSEKTALKDILRMHLWWAFCALNDSQLAFYSLCRKWPICLYTVFNATISTLYVSKRINEHIYQIKPKVCCQKLVPFVLRCHMHLSRIRKVWNISNQLWNF